MGITIVCAGGAVPADDWVDEVRSSLPGHRVVFASNEERIEEALEGSECGAVILDADAPESRWRAAARSVRSRFPAVATAILSRSGRAETVIEAFRENLDGVISETTGDALVKALGAATRRADSRVAADRARSVADIAADYAYSIAIGPDGAAVPEWISSGFESLTGRAPSNGGIGLGYDGIVHADDADIVARRDANLRAGRTSVETFRVVTSAGEDRWVRDRAIAVIDAASGRPVRVEGGARDLTELRKAQSESDGWRARLDAVLTQLPAAMVIAEAPSGKTLTFNKLAEVIIGGPVPGDAGGFAAGIPLARSIRTGDSVSEEEVELLRADGSLGVFRFSATPIRRSDGRVVETVATLSDVTDASQVEKSLDESENLFRTMFEAAAVGIVLTDLEGDVIESNPAFKRILGASSERLAGLRFPEFVGLAEFQRDRRVHERMLDGSLRSFRLEASYAVDGSRTVRTSVTVSFVRGDGGGKPTHAIAFVQDVTRERAAQEAMIRAEKQMRRVADALPVLISYVRADGRYQFVNQTYADWFGIPLAKIRGRRVSELLPPEIHEVLQPHVRNALAGKNQRFEACFKDRRGEKRHFEVTYVSDKTPHGEIRGFFAHVADITDRKRAERDLKRLSARLERKQWVLRKVLQQMPAGLVVASAPSGRLVLRNDRLMEILRHPFRPTKTIAEYEQWSGYHRDGRKLAPEEWPLARAIRTGEEVRGEEILYRRGDGTKAILKLNASPIRDKSRRIVAGVVAVSDVTEEREGADAISAFGRELGRRNADLETLLDVIPIGIAIAEDPECRRIRLNGYIKSLLGIPARANYSCSAPPDERPPWRFFAGGRELMPEELPLQRAVAEKRPVLDHVMDFEVAPGRRVRILTNASPLLDESGVVRGAIAAFLPIVDGEKPG